MNSDGRTNGIALPSRHSQTKLLRDIYGKRQDRSRSNEIAFVEAHGTGTRVGDPIEATSPSGTCSGTAAARPAALKIGSIKSNIGHLEPASGLAGVLKAMLALEHDLLPATRCISMRANPDIPFGELNLEVCSQADSSRLATATRRFAGVNSFGFGGTNAHVVVIGDPPPRASPLEAKRQQLRSVSRCRRTSKARRTGPRPPLRRAPLHGDLRGSARDGRGGGPSPRA